MQLANISITRAAVILVAYVVLGWNCAGAFSADASSLPKIFGHRGGRKWAPENTLASFRRCVERGYGIELDIHECKTGELVVIHDEDVSRTTNGTGLVKDKTLAELRQLSAGKWFDPSFAGEKIPLLSEVLDLVDGKVPIQIEIKNAPVSYEGIDDLLLSLLSHYKAKESITIISFDHGVLNQVHRKAPSYKIGFLDCAIPYDIGRYAKEVGATAWHADCSGIRREDVEQAHHSGTTVSVWTVNSKDDWRRMRSFGVDAMVTDDPDGLHSFLQR